MAEESVTIDVSDFVASAGAMKKLASAVTGPRFMRPALIAMGAHMATRTARSMQAGNDPVTGTAWTKVEKKDGGKTLFSTGSLQRNIVSMRPSISGLDVSLSITRRSPVGKYAFIHQFGGDITPKNAKYLAIPLSKSAKLAKTARRFMNQNKGKAFFFVSKKGNLMIGKARGKTGVTPHFVLVDKVTIPQRRFLGFARDNSDADVFSGILQKHIQSLAKKFADDASL